MQVSELAVQRALQNRRNRQTDRQRDYSMPRGSAHQGIITLQYTTGNVYSQAKYQPQAGREERIASKLHTKTIQGDANLYLAVDGEAVRLD